MGFEIDTPGKGEEITEALPEHRVRVVTGPCEERPVHVLDARVGAQRDVAARRIFDHVVEVETGDAH
ncbi:hypothetical protein ABIB87_001297 [Bradyrhizobium sp. JR18.2]